MVIMALPETDAPAECRTVYGMDARTIDEWYANPPANPTWLVEDLLIDGGISIIAAKPKVGKSTWSRNLATFAAMGHPFLDKKVRKGIGPTLYFGLEDHPGVIIEHFHGLHANGSNLIVITGQIPADPWQYLVDRIEEFKPSLVILDPYARFLRIRDWKDYGEVTEKTQPLISIARDYGTHITGTHHMRKQESTNGNDMDEVLGSAQVTGFVDTMILLRRAEADKRTMRVIQRYGTDWPETYLDFDIDTKQFSLGDRKFDAQVNRNIAKLVQAMKPGEWYLEKDEALTSVVSNRSARQTALKTGSESQPRYLDRRGEGRNKRPYEYSRNEAALELLGHI